MHIGCSHHLLSHQTCVSDEPGWHQYCCNLSGIETDSTHEDLRWTYRHNRDESVRRPHVLQSMWRFDGGRSFLRSQGRRILHGSRSDAVLELRQLRGRHHSCQQNSSSFAGSRPVTNRKGQGTENRSNGLAATCSITGRCHRGVPRDHAPPLL